MRVLIVSQYFWPENFRINDLSAELSKRGHVVTILTGKPNYPSGDLFPEYKKAPDLFGEYMGCNVIRVPIAMRGNGRGLKLVINYFSFVVSASILGFLKTKRQEFDVIFVYEPSPVTVCLPAIFIKKIRKVPVVFWVQDLWPETLEAIGVIKSPRMLRLVGKLVQFIYNRCDLILGQSRAFYDGIASYCDDQTKIGYLPNWSEDDLFEEPKANFVKEIEEDTAKFKVLFAGNIGEAQDLPALINAMGELKRRGVDDVKLFIVGDGRASDSVKNKVYQQGLESDVLFLGRYPLERMPDFFSSVDALVVTLKNSPVFSLTVPSKVQAYMAAGKPILSMLTGEGSRIIEEANCGLTAEAGDFEMLANNIVEMSGYSKQELLALGQNARTYAKKEFNRENLITRLEGWLEVLTKKKREGR